MTRNFLAGFLLFGALIAAQSARAQSFDTNAHCKALASFSGTHSNTLELACRQQEAAAQAAIQRMVIEPSIRDHCTQLATFSGPGSYSLFKACVEQEQAAARQLRP